MSATKNAPKSHKHSPSWSQLEPVPLLRLTMGGAGHSETMKLSAKTSVTLSSASQVSISKTSFIERLKEAYIALCSSNSRTDTIINWSNSRNRGSVHLSLPSRLKVSGSYFPQLETLVLSCSTRPTAMTRSWYIPRLLRTKWLKLRRRIRLSWTRWTTYCQRLATSARRTSRAVLGTGTGL